MSPQIRVSLSRFSVSSRVLVVAILLMLACLAGCSNASDPTLVSTPAGPVEAAGPTPTAAPGPSVNTTAAITTSDAIVLSWWTPEFMSPSATEPSGMLLAEFLTEYETARAGRVRVNPVLKARSGKGGLLDFLRTAQGAAPSVLPDLVSLDIAELEQAQTLGLLQPLERLLDPGLVEGLYPVARQAATFDGHLLAVPVAMDLEHLIYDRSKVATAPAHWTELLDHRVSYAFPAGIPPSTVQGTQGATEDLETAFISQYLSAGGEINPETRELALAEEPLLRVLSFYHDARAASLLPAGILKINELEDSWNTYNSGVVSMANISARRYLVEQESMPGSGYAPLPGWFEQAPPVARGWSLAIITTDPARQQAAGELLAWLLAAERAGAWCEAASWLPTSPEGWAEWNSTPYIEFLQEQISLAASHPRGPSYLSTAAQMRKAIVAVLRDGTSPQQAVGSALNPLPPK